ncbi:MAG: ATP-binding protein [Candidatus Kapaibacteriales bacterium]
MIKQLDKAERIHHKNLKWHCDQDIFEVESTKEVEPLDDIVGQPRALEAIMAGSQIQSKGYNVFVTGISGTGRMTAVKRLLEKIADQCPITYDYAYVNNFKESDKPTLIKMPRGKSFVFKSVFSEALGILKTQLSKIFEEDNYKKKKEEISSRYKKLEEELIGDFDNLLEQTGFVRGTLEIEKGKVVPEVFPLIEEKPVRIQDLPELAKDGKLTEEKAEELLGLYKVYHERVQKLANQGMHLMKAYRRELNDFDKSVSRDFISSVYEDITAEFNTKSVECYVNELIDFTLENLAEVSKGDDADEKILNKYEVNILVDNSETDLPPVIIERYPNYTNLFGSIERKYNQKGGFTSDFTEIRAGSILRADKGYLIVNAQDLFSEPNVWKDLKRVLLYGTLEIQPQSSNGTATHLKPEPIDVDVKVIIIGGQSLYRFLYDNEKGFKKIFKVNAQFDSETERTPKLLSKYVEFIAAICEKESLPHTDRSGIAAICEWASEHAGSQDRITLKFSNVADLIRESAYYHTKNGWGDFINRRDVEHAIEMRQFRSELIDEKLKTQILKGTTLIDTKGKRVGQINGLSVLSTGLVAFGKPSRITAVVSAGKKGIINIEREARMSGSLHDKGLMTITALLQNTFAKEYPMSIQASLAFEQNYGGIDGDSASIAEIYVLLSALSGIPISQEVAVTGSVNQLGDIQPIGGVNEKITGFFDICKERGLTGDQGVIIPMQNKQNLMLSKDVRDAVRAGEFHIWEVSHISHAAPILLDISWGSEKEEDTLLGIVSKVLKVNREKAQEDNVVYTMPRKPHAQPHSGDPIPHSGDGEGQESLNSFSDIEDIIRRDGIHLVE